MVKYGLRSTLLASLSALLAAAPGVPAFAQDALLKRIETLEQELKILKRQAEVDKEEAAAEKAKTPKLEYGRKGAVLSAPDGKSTIGLRGLAQFDGRYFSDDDKETGKDELIARRLRPTLFATFEEFSFRMTPDFAGGTTRLFDAHADYKVVDELQLRVGKFKPPVGLERLQSAGEMAFIERGLPTNLAPTRDFGVQAYGDVGAGLIEYQIGVFNGGADLATNDSDDDEKKDLIGRIFAHPFRKTDLYALHGLGIGAGASTGDREGSSSKAILPEYRSPGQQKIFSYAAGSETAEAVFADGEQWRFYPQAYYYFGPWGVLGEYAVSDQNVRRDADSASLRHDAWQTYISYVLTGEDASFKGVRPERQFNWNNGTWGAWELAARIGEIDFDNDAFPIFASSSSSVTEALSWGVGLNWYLNERVKWQLDYDQTYFDGGASEGGDRPDEKAIFSRVQYVF